MQLLLLLGIPAALFYGYWFFVRKTHPIIAAAQTASAHFESVVPIVEEPEIGLLYEQPETPENPALLESGETVLLMEAERLISEIETIAFSKENVTERLKTLLSGFNLFFNTDYHEAINRFIAVTIKRECELDLPDHEIAALWK